MLLLCERVIFDPPAKTKPPPVILLDPVVPVLPPIDNELRMFAGPYRLYVDPFKGDNVRLVLTLKLSSPLVQLIDIT